MKHRIILVLVIIGIWQGLFLMVHNPLILPCPQDVMLRMVSMISDISFYEILMVTFFHICVVIAISIILAFLLAYIGYTHPIIDAYVSPCLSMIQATPNISIIILLLIWTKALYVVYIILLIVVFPLLYNNYSQGFKDIDQDLKDAITLYHPPFFYKLVHVYLPLMKGHFLSSLRSALSLSVKVTVMAEIMAQLPQGIGREINYSRIQFDMTGVFAWTIWLLIIILLIEYFLQKIITDYK